jgi:formyltetrahydrofolate-dependent phosphoribosylglycinamide formyltransferase
MDMKRLAFLVSGNGSNMANLIRRIKKGEIRRAEAALVISNKPDVKALGRALEFGVPSVVISHGDYDSRESFDEALSECLDRHKIDLVCLCGFMRILTEGFVRKYYGRLVNIHPSFLPDFPGSHAIRDAWNAGVKETGVTVHFVDAGVDTGTVILQKKVPVLSGDTFETLETRIHETEYDVYPEALNLVLEGKVSAR